MLGGDRAAPARPAPQAPASIVLPLLPRTCRRSSAGVDSRLRRERRAARRRDRPARRRLARVADAPGCYLKLAEYFERVAVSDIVWTRTLRWRRAIARLWPGVADVSELHVVGPEQEATLLVGWLRSRIEREVKLRHEPRSGSSLLELDGREVRAREDRWSPSDLLSHEPDRFARDEIYEAAVAASAKSGVPRARTSHDGAPCQTFMTSSVSRNLRSSRRRCSCASRHSRTVSRATRTSMPPRSPPPARPATLDPERRDRVAGCDFGARTANRGADTTGRAGKRTARVGRA